MSSPPNIQTMEDFRRNLKHVFEVLNSSDTLFTEWEAGFIDSVERRWNDFNQLSVRQMEVLLRLYKKA